MTRHLLFLMLFTSILWPHGAQSEQEIKLQCGGKYLSWKSPAVQEYLIEGIYVKIGDTSVNIQGSPGFDATYSITSSTDSSVLWRYDANPEYSGNINRLNGELTLVQMKQDANQVLQLISGSCKRAEPIF